MGKRGQKLCPKCGTPNGPRSFRCKAEGCNYDFMPNKEPKTVPYVAKGIGRGRKQCPSCFKLVGPRTYVCDCGHEFRAVGIVDEKVAVPKKVSKNSVKDWRELPVTTKIKVVQGYGDYYVAQNGEKVYMSDPGIYEVRGSDDNGLIVCGKSGFGYIYMGEPRTSGIMDNVHKEPHKLLMVKQGK